MSEQYDDLAGALRGLRGEIHDLVPVPDAAGLRARAVQQLRVRRAATAVVAAAAVVAVAVGGTTLLRPTAGPPVPPVDSASPSVVPTPAPSGPPVTPSPRPAPVTPAPLDDPITEVDWRNATITIPPRDGCPDGPVTFVAVSDIVQNAIGPADSYPAVLLDASRAAHGDITGDGRAEAVVEASCAASAEGAGDDTQLLVVTREEDGTLVGLGWAPPVDPGSYWTAAGRLLVEALPASAAEWPWEHSVPPGLTTAYRWDGRAFVDQGPAPGYSSIVPLDPYDTGPPVQPRAPVAAGLGCPDEEIRFASSIDDLEAPWLAPTDTDAMYALPPQDGPYLFDLDRTGERLLVLALSCRHRDNSSTNGLAVFERAGDGWQGISVLVSPDGHEPVAWRTEGDEFVVDWQPPDGGDPAPPVSYRWDGTVFEPIDE